MIILAGAWIGLSLAEKYASQRGITPNHFYNLTLVIIISGAAGGRLGYMLQHTEAFASSPLDAFSRNLELFDPFSGVLCVLIFSLIYLQRRNMPWPPTLDALTPAFAVVAASITLAHWASGDAYGIPSSLPWSILQWGEKRHPVQLYQLCINCAILTYLWPGRKAILKWGAGEYFLKFMVFSALGILFTEGFRAESARLWGGYRTVQIYAWLVMAVCILALNYLRRPTPE
jgi:phosphatidylglycerol:prolipoprotein diacylglycerol transferase